MTVLVTGARGMIGSELVRGLIKAGYTVIGVDRGEDPHHYENYTHYQADLADTKRLKEIVETSQVERFIHLAALAHKREQKTLSWEQYYHANVECSRSLFSVAEERPVLYISTVDVYGFYDGKTILNGDSPIRPVTSYGRSKAMAEEACRALPYYSIFRFAPVYTDTEKRDILKRYYLQWPDLAYQLGSGSAFEILNVRRAVEVMVRWCAETPQNDIRVIRDEKLMWTPEYIRREREAGHAGIVLHLPKGLTELVCDMLTRVLGENAKTYLLNKAVHPMRTEYRSEYHG